MKHVQAQDAVQIGARGRVGPPAARACAPIAPASCHASRRRRCWASAPPNDSDDRSRAAGEAPRLARELGIGRLLIKRDDLTGLAFGGNKARNLEFRMAEAVHQGADVFIAGLEAQSNSARLAARTEGLILDPVYTGKAMAGLIDHARRGLLDANSTVVFIHTGGLPALFAFSEEILRSLPA